MCVKAKEGVYVIGDSDPFAESFNSKTTATDG